MKLYSYLFAVYALSVCNDITAIPSRPITSHPLPIVLITNHGTNTSTMQQLLSNYVSETSVIPISLQGTLSSTGNMYDAVQQLISVIYHDNTLRNGFVMIALGTAGLVGRYYLERYNMPPVHTYIALGTPQRGVYGLLSNLTPQHPWLSACGSYTSTILYHSLCQRYMAFSNYWNDPFSHDVYLKQCCFLPYLNNEKAHDYDTLFKKHITNLHHMVLIQGMCDDTIEPAISAHFGFFKEDTDDTLETLFESDLYRQDWLGLKILHETNRLHLRQGSCDYSDFMTHEENFVTNILPFLHHT